jgi:hypothetical protein
MPAWSAFLTLFSVLALSTTLAARVPGCFPSIRSKQQPVSSTFKALLIQPSLKLLLHMFTDLSFLVDVGIGFSVRHLLKLSSGCVYDSLYNYVPLQCMGRPITGFPLFLPLHNWDEFRVRTGRQSFQIRLSILEAFPAHLLLFRFHLSSHMPLIAIFSTESSGLA